MAFKIISIMLLFIYISWKYKRELFKAKTSVEIGNKLGIDFKLIKISFKKIKSDNDKKKKDKKMIVEINSVDLVNANQIELDKLK